MGPPSWMAYKMLMHNDLYLHVGYISILKPGSKVSAEWTEYQSVHFCLKLRVMDSQSSSLEYAINSYKYFFHKKHLTLPSILSIWDKNVHSGTPLAITFEPGLHYNRKLRREGHTSNCLVYMRKIWVRGFEVNSHCLVAI